MQGNDINIFSCTKNMGNRQKSAIVKMLRKHLMYK
jgi:hypothetical protein